MSYCRACGHQIHETALSCPQCGPCKRPARTPNQRNPTMGQIPHCPAPFGCPSPPWYAAPSRCWPVRPQRLDQDQLLGSFLFITTATVLASISLAKQTRGKGMAIAALVMAAIAHCLAPAAPGFEGTHRMTPQPISTLGATMDQTPETISSQMTFATAAANPCISPLSPAPNAAHHNAKAGHHHLTHSCRQRKAKSPQASWPCCWAASASTSSTPAHGAGASSTSCCASPTSPPWWRWSRASATSR